MLYGQGLLIVGALSVLVEVMLLALAIHWTANRAWWERAVVVVGMLAGGALLSWVVFVAIRVAG